VRANVVQWQGPLRGAQESVADSSVALTSLADDLARPLLNTDLAGQCKAACRHSHRSDANVPLHSNLPRRSSTTGH